MNATATRSDTIRVVVIDDTLDLRELLGIALTRGGMRVVGEAGDGRAGIEVVRAERPDIVLLDLSMPVMDGLEALPTIRRLVPEGKIVVLSGFGATQMSERALRLGADGYVQKGQPLKRILEYLRTITDGSTQHEASLPFEPRAPTLTLVPQVPEDDAPTSSAPTSSAPTSSAPTSSAPPEAADRQAIRLAPYGVVEVADEPLLRLVYANPAAQRLLADQAWPDVPLSSIAPLLAQQVVDNRFEGDASFVAEVRGVEVNATLRRGTRSLLLFLDATVGDSGGLRRAIATTAHEIRGPVAVLCGVAEAIEQAGDSLDAERLGRLMASVARQARSLDSITQDLLTASEAQRASLRLDLRDIEPGMVIAGLLEDRGLDTVSLGIHDLRRVRADPLRLEQMVGNLLSNADKYGQPPFAVTVRPHSADQGQLCIDVADSGDGVPDGFRERLFREFSRSPGTVAPGTGLGLYVVKTLADAQGGSVEYADAPSGGAVFTVCLPVIEGERTAGLR